VPQFKTITTEGTSLLESCQQLETSLREPIKIDWAALKDTNAIHLREILDRSGIQMEEFSQFCSEATRSDLLPLAGRLGISIEETLQFLRDASNLGVIQGLYLTTRSWCNPEPWQEEWLEYAGAWGYARSSTDPFPNDFWNRLRAWEVCLSSALLTGGERLQQILGEVAVEHADRRHKDEQDFNLILTEYVARRQCLRKVLLAFLNTGEDVDDRGCGACSYCCAEGEFLPLEQRHERIIRFPNERTTRAAHPE
jgi:hypothetical protein